VIAIDASISMSLRDVRPNRMEVAKRSASVIARSALGSGVPTLIGLIAFYGRSMPLVDLTNNVDLVERAASSISVMGKATNVSEALKDAYFMLKWAPAGYHKRVILITDGDYNEGFDPESLVPLLTLDSVRVDALLISGSTPSKATRLESLAAQTGGKVYVARNVDEALKASAVLAAMD